jgi:AI-2 transport protein TqsA
VSEASTLPGPSQRLVPRGLTILLGLASTVIILAGMRNIADILAAVFLAMVLTIAVHPLHSLLARRVPSWLATVICLIAVYLLLLGLAFSLYISAARFAGLLPEYADQFNQMVDNLTDRLAALGVATEQLQGIAARLDLSTVTDILSGVVAGVFDIASNLVLIVTMLLFMTIDGSVFPKLLARAGELRPTLVDAILKFAGTTRRYLMVGTIFGLIVAALDTLILAILGIPAPFLWGLLAFLTNYIPNIGFVIGLIPPAILALLSGGTGLMLLVIAIYCVINLVIQAAIQPKVVGDTVGLSTSLTFLSLVIWASVLGPLGAVLAIPLTLLVRAIFIDADPEKQWLVPLVANKEERRAKGEAPSQPEKSSPPESPSSGPEQTAPAS